MRCCVLRPVLRVARCALRAACCAVAAACCVLRSCMPPERFRPHARCLQAARCRSKRRGNPSLGSLLESAARSA
eukprot:10247045-Alexandrium_andersonii.AAC.1